VFLLGVLSPAASDCGRWGGPSAIAAMDLDTTGRQLTSLPELPRVARGAATVASRARVAEVDT
jgi:hypothetical protein